ncbi:DUF305 domain-containing protein [Dactylosporangium aurantiacum]|uniref:DUF305 domain-containing protein n=1 Tax=Dactylosporangium aurantiacum TaxID=35754 RepID=A0A9Q9IL99_9ACTN|nr:DUF305 domain-containing protein [Dactylosporangium aurantiacum]MDG6106273.1 DUF305 domain-containing protein [Dactylosporangium aurantiacum]UWZ58229.1 DUF305 domain-containing protein [Dactylosporangium aurantiacum]
MKYATLGRRAVLAGAVLTITVALSSCGVADAGGHDPVAPAHGSVSAGSAFNDVDATFLRMMIPHHQQAVEMAALAGTKATDPQIKRLAAQIGTQQNAEIETMRSWLAAQGQPTTMPDCPGAGCMPSGMMPSGMPAMPGMMSGADMAKLRAATGKDFDRLFLREMIAHHQAAVMMAKVELAHGANQDVKALAGRIVTTQQAEIATMRQLLDQL